MHDPTLEEIMAWGGRWEWIVGFRLIRKNGEKNHYSTWFSGMSRSLPDGIEKKEAKGIPGSRNHTCKGEIIAVL